MQILYTANFHERDHRPHGKQARETSSPAILPIHAQRRPPTRPAGPYPNSDSRENVRYRDTPMKLPSPHYTDYTKRPALPYPIHKGHSHQYFVQVSKQSQQLDIVSMQQMRTRCAYTGPRQHVANPRSTTVTASSDPLTELSSTQPN